MSGICGWSENQLGQEESSTSLRRMVSAQAINPNHTAHQLASQYCSVAAVGKTDTIGVHQQEGVFAAAQGSLRWHDAKLAQIAADQGMACALVAAYREQGSEFLRHISGPFALCIADEARRRTFIAIDRLGIGSLFFTVQNGQLIFASNARAIQHHPDANRRIDPQAVFDYLYFHMVPSPRCIFEGVEKLLPGQYLLLEDGKLTRGFYWQPMYRESQTSSLAELEANFLGMLETSVSRAAGNSKVGTFLSGGTDSSTIAGMLRKIEGKPVDTYSIGFDAEGFDEMEYARIASRHFDTRLHEYYLTPQDVADAIPLIARAYDEPFGNASAVPAYFCAKLARADGIDTLLAGDGGDELFGGNERYAKQKVFELYQQVPSLLRHALIEPAIGQFPWADKVRLVAKAQSYIRQANIPLPDRLESYNFLNRTPLDEIFQEDFLATVNTAEPLLYLRDTYGRAQAKSSLNRMLFVDLKFTLADSDLRKVNRMCELAQVDVRYPLLDEELLRFSTELPPSLKLRGFKLRYFFKHALRDFLPPPILTKSKHGFGLPFGLWMDTHDSLRELSHDSLAAFAKRGIVRDSFIAQVRQHHLEHPSYYGVMLWIMIMLEQWLQSN